MESLLLDINAARFTPHTVLIVAAVRGDTTAMATTEIGFLPSTSDGVLGPLPPTHHDRPHHRLHPYFVG